MPILDTTAIREGWRDNGGNDDVVTLCAAVDVLAETLSDIASAGCSNGLARCCDVDDRGDWCDECTAADALERAGLR